MKKPNIVINLYHAVITGIMFVALTSAMLALSRLRMVKTMVYYRMPKLPTMKSWC